MHLNTLIERKNNPKISVLESSIRACFIKWLKNIKFSKNSTALSISVGDGVWDYLIFENIKNIKKIIATDIVSNPVDPDGIKILKSIGNWEFKKVQAEKPLPFPKDSFDLIYHQDVIEHVKKPYLYLFQQYKVLKKGGTLICGTPNLFRPANILKLFIGKLKFPKKIGYNVEIGNYIHIQEFHEQQLKMLLQEIGFKNIEIQNIYFGILPFNIHISKLPKNTIGKSMCHYLMFKCNK